jgi:transcription factor C subunit 3
VRDREVEVKSGGKTIKDKKITLTQAEAQSGTSGSVDSPKPQALDPKKGVRLFVSEERTWHAVAGHGPDLKKIPKMDFILLSIIAAQKAKGILQGDLVRMSGQDKRSVPSRTDRLAERGYIEKRLVKLRGAKTSLLIHHGYKSVNATQTLEEVQEGFTDFNDLLNRVFDTLKGERIITYIDLKKRLGMEEKKKARALARSIRKLERVGVVKRVRAESEHSKRYGLTHLCVKLLREPDPERDIKLFHMVTQQVPASHGKPDSESEDEDDIDDMYAEREDQSVVPQQDITSGTLQEVGRKVPEWTPDRNIHNLLFACIDRGGWNGMTQFVGFGHFLSPKMMLM